MKRLKRSWKRTRRSCRHGAWKIVNIYAQMFGFSGPWFSRRSKAESAEIWDAMTRVEILRRRNELQLEWARWSVASSLHGAGYMKFAKGGAIRPVFPHEIQQPIPVTKEGIKFRKLLTSLQDPPHTKWDIRKSQFILWDADEDLKEITWDGIADARRDFYKKWWSWEFRNGLFINKKVAEIIHGTTTILSETSP